MIHPKKKSVRVVNKNGKQFFVTEMPGPFTRIWADDFLGDFCDSITIEVYRDGKKIADGGLKSVGLEVPFEKRYSFYGLEQFMDPKNLNALFANRFLPGDILLIPKEAGYKW